MQCLRYKFQSILHQWGSVSWCQFTSYVDCNFKFFLFRFYPCVNGIANVSTIQRCPQGQVCVNIVGVCTATAATVTPSCQICNTCTGENTFTCVTIDSYAPCVAGAVVNWINPCPAGWICNPGGTNTQPCTSLTWTSIPRCPTGQQSFSTTTPKTTAATTVVPTSWCGTQTSVGNYANPSDTTCKTYLKCFYFNGVKKGQKLTCPGTTLFNPTTKLCDSAYTCV